MGKKIKFSLVTPLIVGCFLLFSASVLHAEQIGGGLNTFSRLTLSQRQFLITYISEQLRLLTAELAKLIAAEVEQNRVGNASPTSTPQATPLNSSANQNMPNSLTGLTLPPAPPTSISLFIDKIYPSTGQPGTLVTISGRGFSPTGNTLYTGYSRENNMSSADGKTIKFTVVGDASTDPGAGGPDEYPPPGTCGECSNDSPSVGGQQLWFYLTNSTGVSNGVLFTLINQ